MSLPAVVFAAGRGTRLGALTANLPKPLVPAGGRPIIVHILAGLAAAGIADVIVVTGYRASLLHEALGEGGDLGLRLRYVHQAEPRGTAEALLLARPLLPPGQFFWSWGDIVVDRANYVAALGQARVAPVVLAVNEVDDPSAGAAVYIEDGRVTRLVEKPPAGSSTTRWNNAGFGVLDDAIWPYVEMLTPSERGERELPRALAALVAAGYPVAAAPVQGPWFDIGTPEQLSLADGFLSAQTP